MATLTLRREKGSPLTHDELDDNFFALDSDTSHPKFDSGVYVGGGGIIVEEGDLDMKDGDIILRKGDFKYNPRLAFHDLDAGVDRVIYDSTGGVLVGTDYNGLGSHMRVSRPNGQLVEIGCKTSNSGQIAFVQLGNAGGTNGRSCGVKATQASSDFQDWNLSLTAYNSTDGFVDAIVIDQYGNTTVNEKITFKDSAFFEMGMDVTGDAVFHDNLYVGGNILDGNGNSIADGTVTSVDVQGPTGFTSVGGPVTVSGTVTLGYASTHSLGLPSNSKQGQWDQSYAWGDHSLVGYITDAPNNTNQYARKGGAWAVVTPPSAPLVYTAGSGIGLSGTTFSVAGGNGLTTDASGLSMSGSFTGTFTATGDVVAYSDMTLKENVNPITDALEKVSGLTGITFNRIGEERVSTGLSAQDVKAVLPEAVHTDEEGLHAVAYGNIVGLLVEAIKELKDEVAQLKG
jgi:hypothetical protein